MPRLLTNRIRLRRFHLMIMVLITAIIIFTLLNYFEILSAEIEKNSFNNNLQLIKRMFSIRHLIGNDQSRNCGYLEDENLFQNAYSGLSYGNSPPLKREGLANRWVYDKNNKTLTYYVRSSRFFRSERGSRIQIKFVCVNGAVLYRVSQYGWCKEMRFSGCAQW